MIAYMTTAKSWKNARVVSGSGTETSPVSEVPLPGGPEEDAKIPPVCEFYPASVLCSSSILQQGPNAHIRLWTQINTDTIFTMQESFEVAVISFRSEGEDLCQRG